MSTNSFALKRNCSRACLIILFTLLRWDLYLCIAVDDFFVLAIFFNRFRVRISLLIWELNHGLSEGLKERPKIILFRHYMIMIQVN
jgi:hypothetical protein